MSILYDYDIDYMTYRYVSLLIRNFGCKYTKTIIPQPCGILTHSS